MSDLLYEFDNKLAMITLNRIEKHNAFDDQFLKALQQKLDEAIADPQVRVILLKANGKHFSAGADLAWMQRMADYSEEDNLADSLVLAKVMRTLHQSPKPTLAVVHGSALGGGAGLVAACDIGIASNTARFCFSEVKLGLIPAVISPYVVKAMGEKVAKWLFMTAEAFDAEQAKQWHLIQHCVSEQELWPFSYRYALAMTQLAPKAVSDCKTLIAKVNNQPINDTLMRETATLIAKKRVSSEGQHGLRSFLNKVPPNWN
jgi:methylglutaconyl-CoA hydratase